jgi:hypothetical protein
MTKKDYMKPTMKVVLLHHRTRLLEGSDKDVYGMNKKLKEETVEEAW